MKSSVIKRSIVVNGHKTSVSLEDAFWTGLKDIARSRQARLTEHVAAIDAAREAGNLSSAIRLSVLDHYRQRAHLTTPQEQPAASPPSGAKLVLVE